MLKTVRGTCTVSTWQRGVCVCVAGVGGGGEWHAWQETAIEAGGTHPTGMHSCISGVYPLRKASAHPIMGPLFHSPWMANLDSSNALCNSGSKSDPLLLCPFESLGCGDLLPFPLGGSCRTSWPTGIGVVGSDGRESFVAPAPRWDVDGCGVCGWVLGLLGLL